MDIPLDHNFPEPILNSLRDFITEVNLIRCGEDLRVHDLRHTAVAILISQGVHPEAIKRFLGHSSITVTMDIYGHLFPSEQEALAEALDDAFARSQTDKRRTKVDSTRTQHEVDLHKGQATLDLSEVGPVGLEPTTNGLKARCSTN